MRSGRRLRPGYSGRIFTVDRARLVETLSALLLVGGAGFIVVWALLRTRLARFARLAAAGALVAIAAGTALAAWAWHETRPREKVGSPTVEFQAKQDPSSNRRLKRLVRMEPWPTYGYDAQRTHVSPYAHRPPFRELWRKTEPGYIEFPPTIAYGRVYYSTFTGRFNALDAASGTVVWSKRVRHCSPVSPTLSNHVVFQAYEHSLPCGRHTPGDRGLVIAWNADTGRRLWTFHAGAIETSPLLVGKLLYVGSWNGLVYALHARTGRVRWTFRADAGITSSLARGGGSVFVASNDGRLYSLNAKTGRVLWRAQSFARFGQREYFYATPAVAYGRVFIGNADGIVYAYGAGSGHLLWARRAGTYVYTAAAVWHKTVYVGTWDGYFVALDAATGRIRWRHDAAGGITGAPTVMDGLVYYSTFGTFTNSHERRVEDGQNRTFALDARTGKAVWQFPDGYYSPIVADPARVYLAGVSTVYALGARAPRGRKATPNDATATR